MLEVREVNVFYGQIQALWKVNFTVREGEIVTLLGSNGAGKSTATRTIQGLVRSSSGTIEFQGRPIHRLDSHTIVERGLSLVPEERYLFPYMSVLENLELGAYYPEARRTRQKTLSWIYELFPRLRERSQQKTHTLSGGEQQMVAIGRGLMSKPRLLMLDEPSLGLAPRLVVELFRVIREINQQGISILLVEQNAQMALRLAHRAYVMEVGKITREGTGQELVGDPYIRTAYLGL